MLDITFGGRVVGASFSADGRSIATAISRTEGKTHFGEISLRDSSKGAVVRQMSDPPLNPTSVAFNAASITIGIRSFQVSLIYFWHGMFRPLPSGRRIEALVHR